MTRRRCGVRQPRSHAGRHAACVRVRPASVCRLRDRALAETLAGTRSTVWGHLSDLLKKTRKDPKPDSPVPPTAQLCGQHLLHIAKLGDACSLGSKCSFAHVPTLSKKVDQDLLTELFMKVQAQRSRDDSAPDAAGDSTTAPATTPPGKVTFDRGGRGQGRGPGAGRSDRPILASPEAPASVRVGGDGP